MFIFQSGPIVYAWDTISLDGDEINQKRDKSGGIVYQDYKLVNLSPDTAFVTKIKVRSLINWSIPYFKLLQAKNSVGWSEYSREFLFYTRGKGMRASLSQFILFSRKSF